MFLYYYKILLAFVKFPFIYHFQKRTNVLKNNCIEISIPISSRFSQSSSVCILCIMPDLSMKAIVIDIELD